MPNKPARDGWCGVISARFSHSSLYANNLAEMAAAEVNAANANLSVVCHHTDRQTDREREGQAGRRTDW